MEINCPPCREGILVYQKRFGLIAVLLTGSWGFASDEVKVGLRKQLLVDDWVVAEKHGLARDPRLG